ncbi:PREDICTED: E3 ubiquitin-protein ligase RNF8 isoform X3 [Nanorana parkeri]|uniref:E3 ubiquitin-protein ligase RNF8 isoform X3 n=1 Tax=Nanorana parkeri TaxID=125878 RepID=UPI0008549751|nr:PREDICTED: E3 ubiquitin-protein ligase RNF8 isoform X3 [Nanorana parkeri]
MAEDGELCWCLRRVGEKQERLILPQGEEVTIGRGIGVTYQLSSTSCPLMISRTHCIFRQNTEGQWTATDNNSLNGVWVNKERLEPHKPYTLSKGSSVQFGVPLPNTDKPEFEYEVVQENPEQIQPFLTRPLSGRSKSLRNKRKLNCDDSEASGTEVGTSGVSRAKLQRREEQPNKLPKPDLSKQPTIPVEQPEPDFDMAATQQQWANTLQLSRMKESIAELRILNAQVQEKHTDMQKIKDPEKSQSEDCLLKCRQELNDLQKQLFAKRKEHLQRVRELQKMQQEQQSKSSSAESKAAEEPHLKEQLRQLLQEHSLLMDELNRHHWDFEKIIQDKNRELQETKKEKEKMEAQKEEVLNHMNDVLDNELQCIICSENFIEAVTLNCAHSFCFFCIQSWRKRKDECPICRQDITSQTRSLVLDNCINRMVDKLSQEMKDRRLALILERKGERSRTGSNPNSRRE